MSRQIADWLCQEAEKQHGLVLSRREVKHVLASSAWVRVEPRVWRLRDWPISDKQRLMAATLGSGGVASHRAAAWLHRLDGFERLTPEVTVVRGKNYSRATVHKADELVTVDRQVVDGIPCTTATRTIIDLGAVADLDAVTEAFHSAARRGLTSAAYLERRVTALSQHGRRGLAVARELLGEYQGVHDSRMETVFANICRRARLPMPTLHVPVGKYQVDYAYPDRKVGIELDGFASHGTRAAFGRDRERQNWLVLQGWTLLRFTWDDLRDSPGRVVATILESLAA